MHWEQPAALWLLLALLVLLFVRRAIPRQQRRAAHLHLWAEPESRPVAALSRRFARHRLLLLQAAVIVSIVLAVARPELRWTTPATVVLLDVSMSMGAREGALTRLDDAKARVHSLVQNLPRRSQVRVYLAGAEPRLLGEFAASDSALEMMLRSVMPTDAGADLETAVRLARAAASNAATIHVFSDAIAPVDAADVAWVGIGQPTANAALTLLSLTADATSGRLTALVGGWNFGDTAVTADVVLSAGATPLARQPLVLPATGGSSVAFTLAPFAGDITATLVLDDALAADNVRYATIAAPTPLMAVLIGRSHFVEQALAAHPHIEVMAGMAEPGTANPDIVVCTGCSSALRVNPGAGVLLLPGPDAERAAPAAMVVTSHEHPLLRRVPAAGAVVTPAAPIALPDDAVVLARAGGIPVITAYEQAGRRIVAFGFDPDASAASLDVAFPLLIAETISWLTGVSDRALDAGDPLRLVATTGDAQVTGPDGRPRRHARAASQIIVNETDTAGIYRIASRDEKRAYAINPAVGQESDLSRRPIQGQVRATASDGGPARTSLTTLLLLMALGLLALEWGQRTRPRVA